MNRLMIAATAAAALALGACGETPETNGAAAENSAANDSMMINGVATNVQSVVLEMGDGQRNVVLFRALDDAGVNCQGVTESERIEDNNGQPTWRATCTNGTMHLVSITADGTAHTVSRND
ncbi:hypothetical protein [Stakelama tenebrarum]|uniref:Lipoprotein n=1 Tax=Stakelama tenebrarum TaxID=2711215 RepID=A0A6G6Y586_9SPHN|nr:hypothetical protein [Sphingosinithalassobacter tenebrarum]QIG79736.1 hypothetical protein G5C33_07960 [Sphingosinithalassobacter tenebrarum]